MSAISSLCVYCGSSSGRDPAYTDAGRKLGQSMAEAGIELVYGGGAKGVMGAVAEGVLSGGGRVTGIIPRFLVAKESSQDSLKNLTEVVLTDDMHQRKHQMFERSDGFVALPGGIGTLEEIIEIMTWAQLGRHRKPIAFVNIAGFWNPMSALISHMRDEGFIHTGNLVQPAIIDDPLAVVPAVEAMARAVQDQMLPGDDIVRM